MDGSTQFSTDWCTLLKRAHADHCCFGTKQVCWCLANTGIAGRTCCCEAADHSEDQQKEDCFLYISNALALETIPTIYQSQSVLAVQHTATDCLHLHTCVCSFETQTCRSSTQKTLMHNTACAVGCCFLRFNFMMTSRVALDPCRENANGLN